MTEQKNFLNKNEMLIKALPTYIILVDENDVIVEIHNKHLLPEKLQDVQIVGKNIFFKFPNEKLKEKLSAALKKARNGEENHVKYQTQVDGAKRYFQANLTKFNNELVMITKTEIHEQVKLTQEKDILLHELNHRVKNNFQSILGLVSLTMNQKNVSEDTKNILNTFYDRILAMSQLYTLFYQKDQYDKMNIISYLDQIVDSLSLTRNNVLYIGNQKKVAIKMDNILYIGLIFNELLTNSIKHNNEGVKIYWNLIQENDVVEIYYMDDSNYYCDETDHENIEKNLGSVLINSFCSKLKADMKFTYYDNYLKCTKDSKNIFECSDNRLMLCLSFSKT